MTLLYNYISILFYYNLTNKVLFVVGTEASRRVSSPGPSELFDHKTGKKIVEKICSDVKGLKNVLRKSRRGPR